MRKIAASMHTQRPFSLATFLILTFLAMLTACDASELSSNSHNAGGLDGGTCVRDLGAIQDLLSHPKACASSTQCPAGTFCNSDTGSCDWQCTSDAECGTGNACGCDGVCSNRPSDPGPAPTCERDRALLVDLDVHPRSCIFDEECPQGARCDEQSRRCTAACYETDDAVKGCAAGSVCDCYGRCVTGEPSPIGDARPVRLDVSPRRSPILEVNGTAWTARRLEVYLRAPDEVTATGELQTDVHVQADPGLLVACDDSGVSAPASFATSCDLTTAWTFASVGLQRHAVKYVWVKPAVPVAPATKFVSEGDVVFSSARLADSPATARLAPPIARPDAKAAGTTYAFAGEYAGSVTYLGTSLTTDYDPPARALAQDTAVRAFAGGSGSSEFVDLFDPSLSLTEAGKVRLGPAGSAPIFVELLKDAAYTADYAPGSPYPSDGEHRHAVAIVPGPRSFDPASGVLRGSFVLRWKPKAENQPPIPDPMNPIPSPIQEQNASYRYELRQVAPLTTCAAGCAGGMTCDLGLAGGACVAGTPWANGSNSDGASTNRHGVWWIASRAMVPYLLAAKEHANPVKNYGHSEYFIDDLYDGTTGFARSSFSTGWPVVGGPVLQEPGLHFPSTIDMRNGLPLCRRDFAKYLTWLDAQKGAVSGSFPVNLRTFLTDTDANGAGAVKTGGDAICQAFYQLYDDCLNTSSPTCTPYAENDPTTAPKPVLDNAPCIDPTPIAPSTAGNPIKDWFAELQTQKRGSCKDVFNNYNAGKGTAITEASFYAQLCQDTHEVLRIGKEADAMGTYTQYKVRLCPFRPQMLSTGKDATKEAQAYLCYDRNQTSDFPLVSGHFEFLLPTSGDLGCDGARIPHGAELMYDADRDTGDHEPTPAAAMLQACMADLTAWPDPTLSTLTNVIGRINAMLDDAFADRTCFSWGTFAAATRTLEAVPVSDVKAARLWTRLMGQWLAVHGFIAKEGAQAQRLAAAVGGGTDIDPTDTAAMASTPTTAELLEEMERGWNFFMDYARVPRFQALSADVLLNPDYRAGSGTNLAHHDQKIGLPALVLETAALHLDLVTQHLEDTRLEAYDACRLGGQSAVAERATERGGRALRYTALADSLAADLYDRATAKTCTAATECGTGGTCVTGRCIVARTLVRSFTPTWQVRYDSALATYQAARQRALAAGTALARCENPLGIANGAVPLYFGDVQGNSSRFFAASDYLINSWAKPTVEQARVGLDAARNAWLQVRDSRIQETLSEQDAERRTETISAQYGQQLIDLCGLDNVEASRAIELFQGPNAMTPENCFIARDVTGCERFVGAPGAAWTMFRKMKDDQLPEPSERVTAGGARRRLCMWKELKSDLGIVGGDVRNTFADGFATAVVTAGSLGRLEVKVSGLVRPTSFLYDTDLGQASPDRIDQATAKCTVALGGKAEELPVQADTTPDMTSYAACFGGQLGEAYLGVMGAKKTVERTVLDWEDAEAEYDNASTRCIYLEDNLNEREELTDDHNETMAWMGRARAAAEAASSVISGAATGGGWGAVGGAFGGAASGLGAAMEELERMYQAEMQRLENDLQIYTCYSDARAVKLRIDNFATEVERAIIDADRSIVQLRNGKDKVRQLVGEAPAALARESGRRVPPIAFHFWLDERIDRFQKDFAWARLLVYLAMLSVEHEYQQSLALHGTILRATHPDQLLDALRVLEQEQLGRTINGRRPEDDTLVTSLRDDLLDLGPRVAGAPGERGWSAVQRFQHRLWSPEYAVYDDNGEYLGQGIPFSLAAHGDLDYRCAEKLWRVSATVQGDLLSVAQPNLPLMLVKRNHFGSQWCSNKGPSEEAYQMAAFQPPSQLFHPEDRGGDEAAIYGFVTAKMRPWFNVPRTDFHRDSYVEGASEELAGRGLYGDYVLLFPWHGLLEEGFPLEQVEDVLLRFDYLSVDDITGL